MAAEKERGVGESVRGMLSMGAETPAVWRCVSYFRRMTTSHQRATRADIASSAADIAAAVAAERKEKHNELVRWVPKRWGGCVAYVRIGRQCLENTVERKFADLLQQLAAHGLSLRCLIIERADFDNRPLAQRAGLKALVEEAAHDATKQVFLANLGRISHSRETVATLADGLARTAVEVRLPELPDRALDLSEPMGRMLFDLVAGNAGQPLPRTLASRDIRRILNAPVGDGDRQEQSKS